MGEPDFSLDGVDENEAFIIQDGQIVIDAISHPSGGREGVDFVVKDEDGNDYFLECIAYAMLNRYGKNRLYLAVIDLDGDQTRRYTYYVAQRADGTYLLVHETDDDMYDAFDSTMQAIIAQKKAAAEATTKSKSKSGWPIALKIILFPFWLIWQFIKALLSLFNIAVGDSKTVQAFKRGYNGDSAPMKEYTFTNDMGCSQTVYSSDGREFYDANGSYVGKSNDGGKTIIDE